MAGSDSPANINTCGSWMGNILKLLKLLKLLIFFFTFFSKIIQIEYYLKTTFFCLLRLCNKSTLCQGQQAQMVKCLLLKKFSQRTVVRDSFLPGFFKGSLQKKNLKGVNFSSLSKIWTADLLVAKTVWSPLDYDDPLMIFIIKRW